MSEFLSIANVKETRKGSFKGTCIKATDLDSGTKNGKDWTKKVYTLQDPSGDIELTCWGDEIKLFEVGQFFEVENPWWKERKDKPGVWNAGIGDYCHVTKVDNPPTQKPEETPDPPQPWMEPGKPTIDTSDSSPAEVTSVGVPKLPEFDTDMSIIIGKEAVTLLMIKKRVEKSITQFEKNPHQGMLWQMTEIIYDKHFKVKFEKASSN